MEGTIRPSANELTAITGLTCNAVAGGNSQIGKFLDFRGADYATKAEFLKNAPCLVPTDLIATKAKIVGGVQLYAAKEKIRVISLTDGRETMSVGLIIRGKLHDANGKEIAIDKTKPAFEALADVLAGKLLTATETAFDESDLIWRNGAAQGRKYYIFTITA